MRRSVKKMINGSKAWLRSMGDKGVERHFQKIHHNRFAPNKYLTNFTLLRKYRCLIEELEYEQDPYLRRIISSNLAGLESELKKRHLLSDFKHFD